MSFLANFAHTETAGAAAGHEEASSGILGALGIDWKLFVVQAAAFLILVWLLGKFVYPVIIKAIESRRQAIEEGLSYAKKADEELQKAQQKATELIGDARKEADDVVARSQQEAKGLIAAAEESASQRAKQIVEEAHTQLEVDIQKARQALRDETVKLVAEATEQIIGEKLDTKKDESLISRALKKERA